MRALVVIVLSVFSLAVLHVTYTIADAHRVTHQEITITEDHHLHDYREYGHDTTWHHDRKHKKHHRRPLDTHFVSPQAWNKMKLALNIHGDDSAGMTKDQERKQWRNAGDDIAIAPSIGNDDNFTSKDIIAMALSKPKPEAEDPAKQKDVSIYDQMLGDQPLTANRGNSTAHGKAGRKQGGRRRKGNKKKGKKNKPLHARCDVDEDCQAGSCCIHRKNGRRMCRQVRGRPAGKRCLSSCFCRQGLQCYVSTVRRNGKPRDMSRLKRVIGKCVLPASADQSKGFFITHAPPTQTTPTAAAN